MAAKKKKQWHYKETKQNGIIYAVAYAGFSKRGGQEIQKIFQPKTKFVLLPNLGEDQKKIKVFTQI